MARRSLSNVSTGELQSELRRRVKERDKLLKKRDKLIDQIEAIDQELDQMGIELIEVGAGKRGGGRRGGGGKRPRNEMSLVDSLHSVLKGKQMGVSELADAVQNAGYKTTSPNFRTIVNQALISNTDRFKRVERGLYTTK
ncbi:MAG: hypothetical protein ACF8QF_14470 [Phycisphaerales bacterium]